VTSVRKAFGVLDTAVMRLRDSLTPGQRWTATGALALVLALVGFGTPEHLLFEEAAPTRARPASTTTPRGAPGIAIPGGAISTPSFDTAPSPAAPASSPDSGAGSTVAPPRLAALVSGDTDTPRGDAAMADAFLSARHLEMPVIVIDDDARSTCSAVAAAGADTVLASLGVPAAVRECLADSGVTIISHDTATADRLVATRWDTEHVLRQLGRWGRADALQARVGVVATADTKQAVERATARWRELGIDLQSVVYVESSSGSGDGDAVRELASKGVEVVVLAVPVDVQRRIAGLGAVVLGGARYVVADVFDAVWDEGYLPAFDGAVAYTTARGPWFGRAHGETEQQASCRDTWEAAAVPGVMLASEALRVHAWCAATALAARALENGLPGVTNQRFDSPLTSELVRDGDRFGPSRWAELVWRSNCGCWTERKAFGAPA
jgi:hypothetical protein